MEREPSGQARNRVLRLLSLGLIFSDERCARALSDERYLAAMARFEGALATASAQAGVFPASHADTISKVCEEASFDIGALAKEARLAGTIAIPFVKALTRQVASASADAARYVHFGATSQDAMDTAVALCVKDAAARIGELSVEVGDALAALARGHGRTPTVARTLLQPAAPVPFGWKAAMWLAPLARSYPRFCEAVDEGCVLQFGGAVGTLSAFGEKGIAISQAIGEELGLKPVLTWHSGRDGFARLGGELAILIGVTAKVARDVALLMQPEVGEASEPAGAGRGGSSSMPHKRNPSGCLLALEAAQRAPGLAATLLGELAPEHERGIGQWQAQWLTLRELASAAASALAAMSEILRGLEVNTAAMRANLERTRGLVFSEAVSLRLGRALADKLAEKAACEGKHLLEVMQADPEVGKSMTRNEVKELFDAGRSFGSAPGMVEQVLAKWTIARESAP